MKPSLRAPFCLLLLLPFALSQLKDPRFVLGAARPQVGVARKEDWTEDDSKLCRIEEGNRGMKLVLDPLLKAKVMAQKYVRMKLKELRSGRVKPGEEIPVTFNLQEEAPQYLLPSALQPVKMSEYESSTACGGTDTTSGGIGSTCNSSSGSEGTPDAPIKKKISQVYQKLSEDFQNLEELMLEQKFKEQEKQVETTEGSYKSSKAPKIMGEVKSLNNIITIENLSGDRGNLTRVTLVKRKVVESRQKVEFPKNVACALEPGPGLVASLGPISLKIESKGGGELERQRFLRLGGVNIPSDCVQVISSN